MDPNTLNTIKIVYLVVLFALIFYGMARFGIPKK